MTRASVLTDISCDHCGKSVMQAVFDGDSTPGLQDIRDTHNAVQGKFVFEGGYGSSRFDGDSWQADLCEDCALLVKDFIDQGPGPGVEAENDMLFYPARDEPGVRYTPFSEQEVANYHGDYTCHFHGQPLQIDSNGFTCRQPSCSYRQDWAFDRDFDNPN